MMGQINLVLLGQHYIQNKGSFTLIWSVNVSPTAELRQCISNQWRGGRICESSCHWLDRGIRINAVSPTVIESSPQFPIPG